MTAWARLLAFLKGVAQLVTGSGARPRTPSQLQRRRLWSDLPNAPHRYEDSRSPPCARRLTVFDVCPSMRTAAAGHIQATHLQSLLLDSAFRQQHQQRDIDECELPMMTLQDATCEQQLVAMVPASPQLPQMNQADNRQGQAHGVVGMTVLLQLCPPNSIVSHRLAQPSACHKKSTGNRTCESECMHLSATQLMMTPTV